MTASQRAVLETLRLDSLSLVCPGTASYPLDDRIQVQGLGRLIQTPEAFAARFSRSPAAAVRVGQ